MRTARPLIIGIGVLVSTGILSLNACNTLPRKEPEVTAQLEDLMNIHYLREFSTMGNIPGYSTYKAITNNQEFCLGILERKGKPAILMDASFTGRFSNSGMFPGPAVIGYLERSLDQELKDALLKGEASLVLGKDYTSVPDSGLADATRALIDAGLSLKVTLATTKCERFVIPFSPPPERITSIPYVQYVTPETQGFNVGKNGLLQMN